MGYLCVEIQSRSPERFFNMCMHHHIIIWDLKPVDRAYRFYVTRKGFWKLQPLLKKTNSKIRILKKIGIPFFFFRYRKRKMFFGGILMSICSLWLLSQCMWNIDISGNRMYTDEHIVSFLNSQGIQRSMWKKDVECKQIVTDLRKEFEHIIWVSAHMDGAFLRIAVKENEEVIQQNREEHPIQQGGQETGEKEIENTRIDEIDTSENPKDTDTEVVGMDIVAVSDGIITQMVTRRGTPLVGVGDRVKKGDILVQGRIEIYNDNKEIEDYVYVHADGDVTVESIIEYNDYQSRTYKGKEYKKHSWWQLQLQWGEHSIHTPYLALHRNHTEQIEKFYMISPDQQRKLFAMVGVIQTKYYDWQDAIYTEEEVQRILSERFNVYCTELEEKKVEIIENNVKIHIDKKTATAKGILKVTCSNYKHVQTEQKALPKLALEEGQNE